MSKIKTWNERCEEHPDHQTGMVSNSMIQARMQEEIDELRAALAEPDSDSPERRCGGPGCDMTCCQPVQEPVAYKSDTVCALCAREIALEAETAPFGCVTVRRLSLRHENHADQYQFYPAGQSPYLDNVDECHTVYTAPPQRKPLSEDEIFKIENDIPDDVISDRAWTIWFARAIERAHGIKE